MIIEGPAFLSHIVQIKLLDSDKIITLAKNFLSHIVQIKHIMEQVMCI